MSYKVGDKVLIEAEIFDITGDSIRVRFKDGRITEHYLKGCLTGKPKTYEDGLNDAWVLAKKIMYQLKSYELKKIFGTDNEASILSDAYTPQEALAKIEAYEKSQQIQVGDVVRFKDSKTEVLITSVKDELNGIHIQTDEYGKFGDVHSCICRKDVEKTGKHIDIEHLLEQIRGNE